MKVLAVDPSIDSCGVAWFVDGELIEARHVPTKGSSLAAKLTCLRSAALNLPYDPDLVAIEVPRVYPPRPNERRKKVDPNDLVKLAVACGIFVVLAPQLQLYFPADWKGQRPKDVQNNLTYRDLETLGKVEVANLHGLNARARGDVLDAIGIGWYYLAETQKKERISAKRREKAQDHPKSHHNGKRR